ncbi:MAG TPA: hypothetical protein PLJ84_02495 [Bacteroidales bacterium]|nr:hypothetical protein [Paludibacteraceae bacterium]HPT01438.1 hypothetical protein [Bacteroidales bacterium]
MFATLKYPVLGFIRIRLLIRRECKKWLVELIGSDLQIEVYEDDFVLDRQ